jgi:hypothetical protein
MARGPDGLALGWADGLLGWRDGLPDGLTSGRAEGFGGSAPSVAAGPASTGTRWTG